MSTTANGTSAAGRLWTEPGAQASEQSKPGEGVATKEMFLQLLVAQIKNQNPLNPMDGAEFLGQLSQFTQVEQTLGVREDLQQILATLKAQTS